MKVNQFLQALDLLPTTRIRVLFTIGLITATGVTYLLHACSVRNPATQMCLSWEPSVNWLMFLSALAGVDVTQYFVKGFTAVQHSKVAASISNTTATTRSQEELSAEDGVVSTSDVSEINRENENKG